MKSKRALVIGIDAYRDTPLRGCVNDALSMKQLLSENGDGSPNCSVRTLTSNDQVVTSQLLHRSVTDLFRDPASLVVLYFAGHGWVNPATDEGYLVSQDGTEAAWGLPFSAVLSLANAAHPAIDTTVIILDTCFSGALGEVPAIGGRASSIGTGVTILTATDRQQIAVDGTKHGLFTGILLDGMSGGCADIRGNITPAGLYSHVDQTLGPWEQRPLYKANVDSFIVLRRVQPKIPDDVLRRLPVYFPDPAHVFPLDESYEPDRENVPVPLRQRQRVPAHEAAFKDLQLLNRHGLVVPEGAEHMYYAAINRQGCRLTALGRHYRYLAELKRI